LGTLCSSDEESKGSRKMATLEYNFSVAMFAGWRAGTILLANDVCNLSSLGIASGAGWLIDVRKRWACNI
jgi:hypothetical protein